MQSAKNKIIIVFTCALMLIGQLWYNNQRLSRVFYIISLIIAVCSILMFYLSFEGRKPKEREIVLVCVLCAIVVASRVMFFFSPQIKPMTAILIICAACYGKETGFLVGSISMFVSNFFFSQGPFTPFCMVGMGLVGYFAGVLFYGKKPPLWALMLYGFLSVHLIYAAITNLSTVFLFTDNITLPYIVTVFGAALVFDLAHSISTVVFIALLNKSLSGRFERVKKRYGMLRAV